MSNDIYKKALEEIAKTAGSIKGLVTWAIAIKARDALAAFERAQAEGGDAGVLVSIETLNRWEGQVNDIAARTLKAERHRAAIVLKQELRNLIDDMPTADVAGLSNAELVADLWDELIKRWPELFNLNDSRALIAGVLSTAAHPPAKASEQTALTDGEIVEVWEAWDMSDDGGLTAGPVSFARAILAAQAAKGKS